MSMRITNKNAPSQKVFSIAAKRLEVLVMSEPSTGLNRKVETEYGVLQSKQTKPSSEKVSLKGQFAVNITDSAAT